MPGLPAPKRLIPAIAVGLLLLVAVAGATLGVMGRSASPDHQVVLVSDSPRSTFEQLSKLGIRGQTLVVFSSASGVSERDWRYRSLITESEIASGPPVGSVNLVSEIIQSGMAREAYIVSPPDAWSALEAKLAAHWDVFRVQGAYQKRFAGAPVTFVGPTGASVPSSERTVVVIIDDGSGDYDPAVVSALTAPDRAAIVVRQSGGG